MDPIQEPQTGHPEAVAARVEIITEYLANVDGSDPHWDDTLSAVTMTLVDALLDGNAKLIDEATGPIRTALSEQVVEHAHTRELRGYLLGLLRAAQWGSDRLPAASDIAFESDSHANLILQALSRGGALTSAELREELQISHSQVSRVGRNLLAHGLVVQRRAGREAIWNVTPRGRRIVVRAAGATG